MNKITFVIASALLCGVVAFAQEQPDSVRVEQLQEVVVSAVRASKEAPFSVSNIDRKSLKEFSTTGKELPALFARTPGVVAWSENGVGTGTSYMRIRGAGGSRINVTLDGVPLNSPEDQTVFWANMNSYSSLLSSVQIQRGVGTSTNGDGAFGGTIVEAAPEYKDVKFVGLDVSEYDLVIDAGLKDLSNVYCIVYQEEIAGYLAGYATVKLGYTHLGFCGGMAVPAVIRYGYGYVQGADAAAKELGVDADIQFMHLDIHCMNHSIDIQNDRDGQCHKYKYSVRNPVYIPHRQSENMFFRSPRECQHPVGEHRQRNKHHQKQADPAKIEEDPQPDITCSCKSGLDFSLRKKTAQKGHSCAKKKHCQQQVMILLVGPVFFRCITQPDTPDLERNQMDQYVDGRDDIEIHCTSLLQMSIPAVSRQMQL